MKNNIRVCIGLIGLGFVVSGPLAQSSSVLPSRFLPGDASVASQPPLGKSTQMRTPVCPATTSTRWRSTRRTTSGSREMTRSGTRESRPKFDG